MSGKERRVKTCVYYLTVVTHRLLHMNDWLVETLAEPGREHWGNNRLG